MRTVKHQSLPLNKSKQAALAQLCLAFSLEKRYWIDHLRGWEAQSNLGTPRKIRDAFVKNGYQSHHGLQARHWKLALQDAVETWDKYWQALFPQVRSKISRAKRMTETEKRYAYWLLKGYSQFAAMMSGRTPQPSFEMEEAGRHRIAGYVRGVVKKLKGKPPSVKKSRSAKFDANCYEVFEEEGRQYIKLMSLDRGKRIVIPLCGKGKIEGNITVVISEKSLDVHVSKALKPKKKKEGPIEALDFGYTEVMTDTQGMRYGKQFGKLHTKISNDLHNKMQKRHKIHALQKKRSKDDQEKAKHLLKFNLGRQKQLNKEKTAKATLEREINTGINDFLETKMPSIVITEDLSHLFTYNKSKNMNRKLSSWRRGKIQDRIAFKALAEGFRHEQVNAAYGSQTCPCCGFVDSKNRINDKFKCSYCEHEDISDRVAAMNYAGRFGDQEIGLYTPYSQVKTILLSRFHRRLEMGIPMTVPGRTLDTAANVHPPPGRDNIIAGRENNLVKPGGQSESETNKYVSIRF